MPLILFKEPRSKKRISLSLLPCAYLPSAYADATRVRQILTILLDNAVKFTPAGGTVDSRSQGVREDGSMVLVEVSDTGCRYQAGGNRAKF